MPVRPDVLERAAIRLNRVPGVLLDFLGAQAFRAVCVANELRLFAALEQGPGSSGEIARRVSADERGVRLLLEALEALGYVARRGDRFAATAMSEIWLSPRSPATLANAIPFFDRMVFDRWENLAESIRRGTPVLNGYEWLALHPTQWAAYEEAMLAIARTAAPEIVAKAKVSATARRLLDMGGGHGHYAIEFCRRHPNLSATILDVAPALESARHTIVQQGMASRVTTQEGDLETSDLGAGYDIVLLFNVLHGFSAESNVHLIHRIARCANRGARVFVLEMMPSRAR